MELVETGEQPAAKSNLQRPFQCSFCGSGGFCRLKVPVFLLSALRVNSFGVGWHMFIRAVKLIFSNCSLKWKTFSISFRAKFKEDLVVWDRDVYLWVVFVVACWPGCSVQCWRQDFSWLQTQKLTVVRACLLPCWPTGCLQCCRYDQLFEMLTCGWFFTIMLVCWLPAMILDRYDHICLR